MADQSGKTNKVWWRQTARGGGDRQVKGGDHYQPLSGHFYRGIGEEDDDGEEGEGKRFGLQVKGGDPCPPPLVTSINRYQATSIGGD